MKVNNGLFINIPHIGSDNIKSVVEWYPTIQYNPQPDPYYAIDLLRAVTKETNLTCAFVQNPFDRLVHAWKKYGGNVSLESFFDKLVNGQLSGPAKSRASLQYPYVVGENGKVMVTYVFKTEDLESDFETLKELFDIPRHVTMIGECPSCNPEDYRKHYTEELKTKVTNFYQKDLDYFHYSF